VAAGGPQQLSSGRDGFMPAPEGDIASDTDLVAHLNRLTPRWDLLSRG
jgi:hypothetical protein